MQKILYKPKGLTLILMILLFTGNRIYSEENHISYLEGEVSIINSSGETAADFGMELNEKDRIVTGEDGLAIIELVNGRTLKIKENSALSLNNTGRETELQLSRGSLFAKVRKLTGGSFSVRTESVVAGVRGTEFFLSLGKTVEESPDIWLCVNEGAVEVELASSGESVVVNEGEGISILSGKVLTPPRVYSWTKDLNWNTDPSTGPVEDSTSLEGVYSDLQDQDYF